MVSFKQVTLKGANDLNRKTMQVCSKKKNGARSNE
jgi:hypothetical protein